MLTPKFSCSQSDLTVIIQIHTPAIRAAEVEIYAEGRVFSLHVNPYFLRLQLPGNIVEDDKSEAVYNPSSGDLVVTLSKESPGEHFADLDLLSKLLAPLRAKGISESQVPLVEVMRSDTSEIEEATGMLSLSDTEVAEGEAIDWQLPQKIVSDEELPVPINIHYGFLNRYSGYLKNAAYTENEVNELGDQAETTPPRERRLKRESHENDKFDEQYYMADFARDDAIKELIAWRHPYQGTTIASFSEEDELALLRLPGREYLISYGDSRTLYLTLISLLFAYAYDSRSTQHDPTTESAWTISVLIPAFSALDTSCSSSLTEIFRALYRRALSFPLYRSWILCERCRLDIADVLAGGQRTVLKCLLEMKFILDRHDVYYIYSKIWLEDYCVWVQQYGSSETLKDLGRSVQIFAVDKNSIGWDLGELENMTLEPPNRDSDDESEDDLENMPPSAL